jgi:CRISPR-associated protein Cas1
LLQAADSLSAAAASASAAASHPELLGCEGSGAAAHFRAFALMNRSGFPFETRRMHPPPDPVNALLSLGYTMATNELRGVAEAHGLEPHIGFLHQIDYGRPSLALDLVEPFRPALVDRLTLRLINERILKLEDFGQRVSGAGGVILVPEAFKRYLEQYESAIAEPSKAAPAGLREAMRGDVAKLARALADGCAFEPFVEVD